ncbi:MAG TPA: hypothetical protein VGG78_08085, partial [Gemmatimonadaceae bacterium]
MLLQHFAVGTHPLADTAARFVWLLPLLPLLGFVLNGLLSLVASYHPGPDDPSGHDAHAAHADAHSESASGGAHGDDHHPVVRHRFATLTTIIGPGVLALSFVLA